MEWLAFEGGIFTVGAFHAVPGDGLWATPMRVGDRGSLLVFPETAVRITQFGVDSVVANTTNVILHDRGREHRRDVIDPAGDHCVPRQVRTDQPAHPPAGTADRTAPGIALRGSAARGGGTLSGRRAVDRPATTAVVATHVGGDPCGIAFADGDLWMATVQGEQVLGFDIGRGEVVDRIGVGDTIWDLQAGEDGVWVALRSKADVLRIDPSDGQITARVHMGGTLSGLAVTSHGVRVADGVGDRVVRIDPDAGAIAIDRRLDGFGPHGWVQRGSGSGWPR